MNIRSLNPSDATAYRTLRLQALQECPTAFGPSHDEERDTPLETIAERLAPATQRTVFGAFDRDNLMGIVGLSRETMQKYTHKGYLWGMYVAPEHRQLGIGKTLIQHAVQFAASTLGLRQINLFVNARNAEAISLYASVGFQIYGIERNSMIVDHVFQDEILMACQLRA